MGAEANKTLFVRRAIETGAVLDTPTDRKVAQSLIDYWIASAYSASDAGGTRPPALWGVNALLKPFDESFMRAIADHIDAAVRNLDVKDQALTQRLLLRLVRFRDETWVSSPKIRDTLLSAADATRENKIIELLHREGALIITPSARGDLIEIRYEALLRQWERLHGWVDERAKFRSAALFWVRSGNNKGALLSSSLAKSAAEYGDLEPVERDFIDKSQRHARRVRRTAILVAALLFLVPSIPLSIYIFLDWYSKVYIPRVAAKALYDARSSYTKPEDRMQNMLWLAQHGQPFDFSRTILRNFILKDLGMQQANFRQAILEDVDFTGATLISAHFDYAQLQKIKFTKANLNGAVFDQARLCDADFSGADLTNASFLNSIYNESLPPNLKDTAWWLSTGWNLQQVDLFRKQQDGHDPIIADNRNALSQKNPTYLDGMNRFEGKLKSSGNGTLQRAVALDGKAWYRAIWGLELADAEMSAQEAANIMESLEPKPDFLTKSYVVDTLAYVLLQMDRIQDARRWLEIAREARENPGATFRYALVLHILGDESEAERNLKIAVRDRYYWPSHELLLLRRHFNDWDSFIRTFAQLSERPQALIRPACPN